MTDGRVALVTGGAHGIGGAVVRRLAAGGASVVVADVDLSGAGDQPETSAQTLHVALAIPESEAERMVEERTAR